MKVIILLLSKMSFSSILSSPGMVYLCTTQYSSRYLNTYQAHNTPVYNIQWNTFIPNIFITCASEWIIKIWDKDCKLVTI